MKKILAMIVSGTMLLSLTACFNAGGTTTEKETTNETVNDTVASEETVASEDNGGDVDETKDNTDPGAIVLLPGELYQFDKDVIKGLTLKGNQLGSSEFNEKDPDVKGIRCIFLLNEWIEIYPDTSVDDGLWVYVYKHADDANVYTEMGFTEEDTKVLAVCNLTKPETEGDQWGSFYLNPDSADPGIYDIVFVKNGKAVAVMEANFFKEDSLIDKSDDELGALMKDF
jgi:hypothetical protein